VGRLLDVEITYEIESTTRNPLAVCIAHWADRVGARTALVSDMYLHAPHIDRIVTAHLQEDREMFGSLVSSADAVISKGSGLLFDQLAELHEIEPSAHLHFGDNVRTDFKVPISKGWRACLLPVPVLERELIEQDYLNFVTELAEEGLDLGTWIKSGA
jgi:predicted HAD superfamily hydrolase